MARPAQRAALFRAGYEPGEEHYGIKPVPMIAMVFLGVVLFLIAVRRIGGFRVRIWQAMGFGALGVLVTGQIAPLDAVRAIDPDVMLFLFGVFVIGRALEESGFLSRLSFALLGRTRSVGTLVLAVLFGVGLLSAFLMNDTLAVIGTPVVLALASRSGLSPKLLLLALAFAVTTGSVMSPVGNPQNLLIALEGGLDNPFVTFVRYLAVPTLINLLLAWLALRLFFRRDFSGGRVVHAEGAVTDPALARLSGLSLGLLAGLILVKIIIVMGGWQVDFRLTYIALGAALPVLLFSRRRVEVVRRIDWPTLVFFAAMFVLMQSVWDTGIFQRLLDSSGLDLSGTGPVLSISVAFSQLISNVPLVALYLPVLGGHGFTVPALMALAAGSTIAGNFMLLGAASNIIIVQSAEKTGARLSFWDFLRAGAPLTLVNVLVYWGWLTVVT